ncbi:MAG: hypothetical protein GX254_07065 [Clostridiales bacterium]|jgi:hypothetical protein|nr:hypothetical protein [Clostridiales bacterium]
MAFANDNYGGEDMHGEFTLWLCKCRITSVVMMDRRNGFRQVKLELVKDKKLNSCENTGKDDRGFHGFSGQGLGC